MSLNVSKPQIENNPPKALVQESNDPRGSKPEVAAVAAETAPKVAAPVIVAGTAPKVALPNVAAPVKYPTPEEVRALTKVNSKAKSYRDSHPTPPVIEESGRDREFKAAMRKRQWPELTRMVEYRPEPTGEQ